MSDQNPYESSIRSNDGPGRSMVIRIAAAVLSGVLFVLALIGFGYTVAACVLAFVWHEPSAFLLAPICVLMTMSCLCGPQFLRTERFIYLVVALGLLAIVAVLVAVFEFNYG